MELIFKFFFKKKFTEYENKSKDLFSQIEKLCRENNNLEKELDRERSIIERIQFLLNENSYKANQIRIEKTSKRVLSMIFIKKSSNTKEIIIYDIESTEIYDNPIITAFMTGRGDTLHIDDIQGGKSLGHCSLAMKYILEIAKEQNYKLITGRLSNDDKNHKESLLHFYKKHGFTITLEDKGNYFGSIIRVIE